MQATWMLYAEWASDHRSRRVDRKRPDAFPGAARIALQIAV
jgi:hypothetical protein